MRYSPLGPRYRRMLLWAVDLTIAAPRFRRDHLSGWCAALWRGRTGLRGEDHPASTPRGRETIGGEIEFDFIAPAVLNTPGPHRIYDALEEVIAQGLGET